MSLVIFKIQNEEGWVPNDVTDILFVFGTMFSSVDDGSSRLKMSSSQEVSADPL